MTRPDDRIDAPKGVQDVYGAQARRRAALERHFTEIADRYGYGEVRIPVFEHTDLFVRSVGAATDIVRKEMYTFDDRGGRSLTLRPEGTAGVVRCFVEHHLDQAGLPWKAAYSGPMFRAENVQRGRQREFSQLGVEAIGVADADLDVEVIALGWEFLRSVGLRETTLRINTLGTPDERAAYARQLRDYVAGALGDEIGRDDAERLEMNPLRILDSKDPATVAVLGDAPKLRDTLGAESAAFFAEVLAGLDDLAIPYAVDDRLVRGLDYYTQTAFEYASASLDAAQNALGGGGRYDGLVAEVGGPDLPGIGFALGVERILLAADAEGVFAAPEDAVDVVIVSAGEVRGVVRRLAAELRAAGVRVDVAFGGRSLKAQFKHADRRGARHTVVVGERDLAEGTLTVRDLVTGDQRAVPTGTVVKELTGAAGPTEEVHE